MATTVDAVALSSVTHYFRVANGETPAPAAWTPPPRAARSAPSSGGMSAMPEDGIGIRGKYRRSRHAGLSVHLNCMQGAAVESKG